MIHYLIELSSGIFLTILDFSLLIIVDVYSTLGYLHRAEVGNVTDVSEVARIFETTAVHLLYTLQKLNSRITIPRNVNVNSTIQLMARFN
jgi:hypothetical protein